MTATSLSPTVDRALVAQLVGEARQRGLSIDGENGLLAELTKLVVESALEGELTDHLGYDKHETWRLGGRQRPQRHPVEDGADARPGRSRSTCRGTGRARSSPVIVAKRQRRLGSIEDVVLSLSARGHDPR